MKQNRGREVVAVLAVRWDQRASSDQLRLTRPLFSQRRTDFADFHRPRFCMDSNVSQVFGPVHRSTTVAAMIWHHVYLQVRGGSAEQQQILCVV